jgi:hypothetical protein
MVSTFVLKSEKAKKQHKFKHNPNWHIKMKATVFGPLHAYQLN